MCAVIAGFNHNGVDMITFRKLLLQSMENSQETTISWFEDKKIRSLKNAEKNDLFELGNVDTPLILAHCRHYMGNFEYNYPMSGEDYAIAHDAEVHTKSILNTFDLDLHPLQVFPTEPISCAMILNEREGAELGFFRNGYKHLWYDYEDDDNCCWVTTRKDSFAESDITIFPKLCEAGHHYRITEKNGYMAYQFVEGFEETKP